MPTQFNPERLREARHLRGTTATALASATGVSPAWLSKVEKGHEAPGGELVGKLAAALELPTMYFFEESARLPSSESFYFRATSKLALKDESAARALASIALDLSHWLERTYTLPAPAVPEVQDLSDADVEFETDSITELLRASWGLGSTPVSSMLALLESRGTRVFAAGSHQAIDAFSFRHGPAALVFLNPGKSRERLRFDLAHELGHIVLHGGSLNEPDKKLRERQANRFASAFLMPRTGILGSLRGNVSLDSVFALRDQWRVSAMSVVVRLRDLDLISDWTYRLLCQELARRGFRRTEHGSTLAPEVSSLWTQVLADLRAQGLGISHLASIANVKPDDVRSLLAGIVPLPVAGGASTQSPGRATLSLV